MLYLILGFRDWKFILPFSSLWRRVGTNVLKEQAVSYLHFHPVGKKQYVSPKSRYLHGVITQVSPIWTQWLWGTRLEPGTQFCDRKSKGNVGKCVSCKEGWHSLESRKAGYRSVPPVGLWRINGKQNWINFQCLLSHMDRENPPFPFQHLILLRDIALRGKQSHSLTL
jgi:hypothetical protein